jgi:3-isopropylmalate/(R)-2-methylmalate dehydratase small subunit
MSIEKIRQVAGRALPLRGDNIDTDRIIPARFLKSITFEGLERHVFEDDRAQLEADGRTRHPVSDPAYAGASLLLVNANFGCGSSREHAPWALTAWGIRAILSTSFADIFRSNSLKNGLLPIVVEEGRHRQLLELIAARPDAELRVDLETQLVHLPGDEDLPFDVDPFARHMLLAGTDELGYLLAKDAEIAAWERTHPARIDTRAGAR